MPVLFPTKPILDTGVRADENPLSFGGKWQTQEFMEILNNLIQGPHAGSAFWTQEFIGDAEAYVTQWVTDPIVSQLTFIGVRMLPFLSGFPFPGQQMDPGYGMYTPSCGSSDQWVLVRRQGGDHGLALIPSGTLFYGSGDSVGISAIGSTITGWHKQAGGAWTAIMTAVDATFPGPGYIALSSVSGGCNWTDFGGGGRTGNPIIMSG